MNQAIGYRDKYAARTTRQQLLVDDQSGFDGFTQSDLVGE